MSHEIRDDSKVKRFIRIDWFEGKLKLTMSIATTHTKTTLFSTDGEVLIYPTSNPDPRLKIPVRAPRKAALSNNETKNVAAITSGIESGESICSICCSSSTTDQDSCFVIVL